MASDYAKEIIDLYYVGGLSDNDGPQFITTGGEALIVPPIGESLRLPRYKAEDIISRYNVKGVNPFSYSKDPTVTAPANKEFTREELLAMLAKLSAPSGMAVPVMVVDPVEEVQLDLTGEPDAEPTPEPAPEPTPAPAVSRSKKKDQAPAKTEE